VQKPVTVAIRYWLRGACISSGFAIFATVKTLQRYVRRGKSPMFSPRGYQLVISKMRDTPIWFGNSAEYSGPAEGTRLLAKLEKQPATGVGYVSPSEFAQHV